MTHTQLISDKCPAEHLTVRVNATSHGLSALKQIIRDFSITELLCIYTGLDILQDLEDVDDNDHVSC